MRAMVEGSWAVAEGVRLCRPQVIAAYPITPQTHIVEHIAQMIADGKLDAQYINTESEYASISLVLGAVAAGSRAFTATASQGLLLMTEILYNIAGMRIPVVMACANRAVSAPINIFSDHQDSMAMRDAGWIQLYVENNQEAMDTVIQAYKIAERCGLPVMVCMDGFYLTHTFSAVDLPAQDQVDAFLPPFQFARVLDPLAPLTLGGGSEAGNYLESRHDQHIALHNALDVVQAVSGDYSKLFSRDHGGVLQCYRTEQAERILVILGSLFGAARDVVDEMRSAGEAVGAVRIRCHRPFPAAALIEAVKNAARIVVLEKAFSAGRGGILVNEIVSVLAQAGLRIPVHGYIGGLGGRDIHLAELRQLLSTDAVSSNEPVFLGVRESANASG